MELCETATATTYGGACGSGSGSGSGNGLTLTAAVQHLCCQKPWRRQWYRVEPSWVAVWDEAGRLRRTIRDILSHQLALAPPKCHLDSEAELENHVHSCQNYDGLWHYFWTLVGYFWCWLFFVPKMQNVSRCSCKLSVLNHATPKN